jgi:hypothetical protein
MLLNAQHPAAHRAEATEVKTGRLSCSKTSSRVADLVR